MRGAAVDHGLDARFDLAGQRGEQVDAERLGGQLADRGHLGRQLVGPHRRGTQRADPAGLADRGDQAVVADAAHPGEHDRVLDVEQFGQPRAHAPHRIESHPSVCVPRISIGVFAATT